MEAVELLSCLKMSVMGSVLYCLPNKLRKMTYMCAEFCEKGVLWVRK